MTAALRIRDHVTALYGAERADTVCADIERLICRMPVPDSPMRYAFGPADTVLITYGNTLRRDGEAPLRTLKSFADHYLADVFNTIHILPFFPYSSDDGFSVIDYTRVDPALGTWADVAAIGQGFRLMFDFVLNHISARSPWIRSYLEGTPDFTDLAIGVAPETDLSHVARPRVSPLLTSFERTDGPPVWLWTTFGPDQVDLNWANPAVLMRMLEVMLGYVQRGADILRLDAVAYLWKTIGSDCIHRPETHRMVKLLRAVLDRMAPQAVLLTETNVPHAENISYLGSGTDEAQMVYNFTLPPLLLHTLIGEDATVLSTWAAGLGTPAPEATFFNFTASHDGIGVRPLEGILPASAVDRLLARACANGGRVSMRTGSEGRQQPYELNVTFLDALRRPGPEPDPWLAARFMASQSIQYVLPGVPATYIHSLLGSRNWQEGVARSGQARRINRQPLDLDAVVGELSDRHGVRRAVFEAYCRMVQIRRRQPAFSPRAAADILDLGSSVFAIRRRADAQTIWAVSNVTERACQVALGEPGGDLIDLIDRSVWPRIGIKLGPYQYRWLTVAVEG